MTQYTIYRITTGDSHYIGSTKDFNKRKSQHRGNCKMGSLLPVHQTIIANGGWDACQMIPIEQLDCEQRITALIREEYWRRQFYNTLNVHKAHTTEEEFKERKIANNAKSNPIHNAKRDLSYIICACGGEFQAHCRTSHVRGKRHNEYLQTQVPN